MALSLLSPPGLEVSALPHLALQQYCGRPEVPLMLAVIYTVKGHFFRPCLSGSGRNLGGLRLSLPTYQLSAFPLPIKSLPDSARGSKTRQLVTSLPFSAPITGVAPLITAVMATGSQAQLGQQNQIKGWGQ